MVDWKKLENEVDCSIRKQDSCYIKFELPKTPIECKYQQKYAEDKRLIYERRYNLAIFAAAIGIPFFISGFFDSKPEFFRLGSFYIIIALVFLYFTIDRFRVCSTIILNAERRILSETSEEIKQPQETLQKQERIEPIAEPKERKYPDIWEMYIAIAVFFFTIYPVARDYVEKPSTFNTVFLLAVEWLIIFAVGAVAAILIFKRYFRPKI